MLIWKIDQLAVKLFLVLCDPLLLPVGLACLLLLFPLPGIATQFWDVVIFLLAPVLFGHSHLFDAGTKQMGFLTNFPAKCVSTDAMTATHPPAKNALFPCLSWYCLCGWDPKCLFPIAPHWPWLLWRLGWYPWFSEGLSGLFWCFI